MAIHFSNYVKQQSFPQKKKKRKNQHLFCLSKKYIGTLFAYQKSKIKIGKNSPDTIIKGGVMNISSISSNNSSLYSYQWNNQQLQSVSNNNSGNQTPSQYAFQGTSTVSSMVELATYAMEKMGVSGNEKVTFSQIEKYKAELEEQFSQNLNASIQNLNISDDAYFTVNLDAEGNVSISTSHSDKAKIQTYFDTYPAKMNDLRQKLDDAGFEGDVQFSVASDGSVSSVRANPNPKITQLSDSTLGNSILENIKEDEDVVIQPFSLVINNANLELDSSSEGHAQSDAIGNYLTNNPQLAEEIKATIEAQGLTDNVRIHVSSEGKVSVEDLNQSSDEFQADVALQELLSSQGVGTNVKSDLKSLGIDPNIDFRLTVEEGRVVVSGSHADVYKIQAIIDNDESLTKDYLQVDALAGLDGARKAMQIDPSATRKRIQMESLAAWWQDSGTSSIGSFSAGNLTTFAGVNSVA